MSIYISYHPLDYDFAHDLLIYLRNLGFSTILCIPNSHEKLEQGIVKRDKLIAILRPEYLQSVDYLQAVNISEIVSDFFPVLRGPISIDEWASNIVFRPIADFTNRDNNLIKENLEILKEMIVNSDETLPAAVPSPREVYLNNLSVTLRAYIRPLISLECINYISDEANELPVNLFLGKSQFKIGTLTKEKEWGESYEWNRQDSLEHLVKYYRFLVVVCNEIDCSAMAYYLVDTARHHAQADPNASIPVLLDIEHWPMHMTWVDWLINQITFSENPLEDIATGKFGLYAYGLDHIAFKNHPMKNSFEEWLYGNRPPRYFVIICSYRSNLDICLLSATIATSVVSNIDQLRAICLRYADRPFSQYVIASTNNKISPPIFTYFLQNPVLVVMLLSVKFDDDVNFSRLGVSEYFQALINNLWQIAVSRQHENQVDIREAENLLFRLAALATEQERVHLSYSNIMQLVSSNTIMMACIDADFLSIANNAISFTMPAIQDYFAAKALAEFGIPTQLPNLALDKSFRRLPQRWDKPIVIASHISPDKEQALKRVAKSDPLLALRCITSGIRVSESFYKFIIEQNLSSLVTLGDFRVDFATLLYYLDPVAARAIFIEILRDANWSIRLNAFTVFMGLETSFLPGLAEAIAGITENTRNQISRALHRLGTDALSTLFVLLKRDSPNIRQNAIWALGELRDKAAVPALVEVICDNDLLVSRQAVTSLDLLQDINCVPYLVQSLDLQHTGIQNSVGITLSNFQDNMPEQFVLLVKKMDATAKRRVIRILQGAKNNTSVDFLLEMSRDENVEVRLAAINELGKHHETRVISRLEDCLTDMTKSRMSKSTVSEVVTKILSNIQKSEAVPNNNGNPTDTANIKPVKSSEIVKARLLQVKETRLKEPDISDSPEKLPTGNNNIVIPQGSSISTLGDDSYVSAILAQLRERTWTSSSNAAKTLREYVKDLHGTASLHVINQILETLNDDDWVIRWTGVETLGWTGNVYVVPHLLQRLTDNNWKIRVAAIRSLSEIGDHTAVAGLASLLSDNNSIVREAAAEALGLFDEKEALLALESAAVDQEDFVRLAAVESLGKMHQQTNAKILFSALKDKSEHVRWAAANSLSGRASAEMVSFLVPSLSDTAGPYWEQKRICDVIVDILKQIGSDEALSAIAGWGNSQM